MQGVTNAVNYATFCKHMGWTMLEFGFMNVFKLLNCQVPVCVAHAQTLYNAHRFCSVRLKFCLCARSKASRPNEPACSSLLAILPFDPSQWLKYDSFVSSF